MDILFLIIGVTLGFSIGWFLQKSKKGKAEGTDDSNKLDAMQAKALNYEKQLLVAQERDKILLADLERHQEALSEEQAKTMDLTKRLASAETHFNEQQIRLAEQKDEVAQMNEKMTKEFESISAKLIKDNTQHLSEVSHQQVSNSLKPLGEKLKQFEERIERSSAERNTLKGELNKLFDLNQKMASEAQNLTSALKGDTKQQGNWGELILERVLESSGLEEGREYRTQHSTTGEDGQRLQPDVIINLPDEKHIVVDSKVSLVAYDEFVNSSDKELQLRAAKQHITSIKNHIKGLSEKNYQQAKGIHSPDFVLLFMPIEPAFSMALQTDHDLFSYAWDRKIVIVSPTTLLATLRTIASIWKQEKQTQNAMKIAEEGGKLHDKFVDFVKDMDEIGSRIEQTGKAYDSAMNKLSTGRGNAIKKADDLRKLGAKTAKQMDAKLLEKKD